MNNQKIINQKINYITILKQIGGQDEKIQEILQSIENMKVSVGKIDEYINQTKEVNKKYAEYLNTSTDLFKSATEAFTDTERALQDLNNNLNQSSKTNIAELLKDIEL